MMLRLGTRVRIVKEGVLNGQEGNVNGVDGDTVLVVLDEGTTVGVSINEVQPLPQQQANPAQQLVQVKLPDGIMVQCQGVPAETVLSVVRMHPMARMQLQQQLGEVLPEVALGGHSMNPDTGIATPFGVGMPPGIAGHPMAAGMPLPSYPSPPGSDHAMMRLVLARQLLDTFIHMRHHMIEAAGVPDDEDAPPGEEWKQRAAAENAHVFEFSATETKLYESACNVLAAFLNGDEQAPH